MVSPEEITKTAKVIVPENWDNNRKGIFWEKLVADLLRKRGWVVNERIKFTGMEIDCLAENPEIHQKAYIECKFFHKKLIDSDVVDRLLGKAGRRDVEFAYLFCTTEPGAEAKGIIYEENEKNKKDSSRKPRLVFVSPEDIAKMFMDLKGIELPELSKNNIGKVKFLTLLISPEQILWVAEEIENGEPHKAIIFPTSPQDKINLSELSSDFSRLNLWQGLEIIDGAKIKNKISHKSHSVSEIDKEVVSPIGVAESFEHYQRPCRPQDFVGRCSLREKFWDFLKNVRNGKTSTRIVCFSGNSGLGKSSLVLRLAEDCSQKKYKDSFYLYHIDVRSAKGALFVVSAIRSAIQKAIDDEFIEIPDHTVLIESTEQPLLSSQSIRLAIEKLQSSRRVLIIFFDQFEEIFTKESLLCVYELFEKIAHEFDSLKGNIVLGFCWRTGISMPDGHKAYHLWHGLKDKRLELGVKDFSQEESLNLLKQFDKYLNQRRKPLERKLKKWLLEYCPGFPWLLRKVLGDIYDQTLNESEIIPGRQVDIKELFDKDLEMYITTGEQASCLRYIAKYSPVSMNEVIEKFGISTIQCLEEHRLVIRTGFNYTIYWDIFREYILEEKVPTIPLSYRPRNRIPTVLEIFKLITQAGTKGIKMTELVSRTKQKKPTVKSIVLDLQNFGLVTCQKDNIKAQPDLVNAVDDRVAAHLARQLEEHIVIREVYEQLKPGKIMTLWGFQKIVAKAYSIEDNDNKKTTQDYASRMLSWFLFAGLLEKQQKQRILRPVGEGKQKGKSLDCVLSSSKEDAELPLLKLLS